jgi:hypothetical protein
VYRAKELENTESLRGALGLMRFFGKAAWRAESLRRNDRVRSGVLTEAVEGVLIRANQTLLTGG